MDVPDVMRVALQMCCVCACTRVQSVSERAGASRSECGKRASERTRAGVNNNKCTVEPFQLMRIKPHRTANPEPLCFVLSAAVRSEGG